MVMMTTIGFSRLFVFISIVSAAMLFSRDAASVLAGLKTINSDITTVKNALDSFTGQQSQCLAIAQAANKLNKDVNTLAADLENDPTPINSNTDVNNIINYINNTLVPNLKAAVQSLRAKKSTLASVCGFDVDSYLKTLSQSFQRLQKALLVKIPGPRKSDFQKAADNIQAAFATT